jgi:hypothetical protein
MTVVCNKPEYSIGGTIEEVLKDLKQTNKDEIDLSFNDIIITVHKNSLVYDLITVYNLKHEIRYMKTH